jgi:hypothetical protein
VFENEEILNQSHLQSIGQHLITIKVAKHLSRQGQTVSLTVIFEKLTNFNSVLTDGIVRSIVQKTVAENKLHVAHKSIWTLITVMTKFLFDGGEIHWVGDLDEIVGDVELYWIYWLLKEETAFSFPTCSQCLQGEFLPALLLLGLYAIQLGLLNRIWIT